jgi:hypothetical protein
MQPSGSAIDTVVARKPMAALCLRGYLGPHGMCEPPRLECCCTVIPCLCLQAVDATRFPSRILNTAQTCDAALQLDKLFAKCSRKPDHSINTGLSKTKAPIIRSSGSDRSRAQIIGCCREPLHDQGLAYGIHHAFCRWSSSIPDKSVDL